MDDGHRGQHSFGAQSKKRLGKKIFSNGSEPLPQSLIRVQPAHKSKYASHSSSNYRSQWRAPPNTKQKNRGKPGKMDGPVGTGTPAARPRRCRPPPRCCQWRSSCWASGAPPTGCSCGGGRTMTCVDTGTCRTAAWGTNPPPTIGDTTLVGKSGYFREIILRRGALPLGGSGMGGA